MHSNLFCVCVFSFIIFLFCVAPFFDRNRSKYKSYSFFSSLQFVHSFRSNAFVCAKKSSPSHTKRTYSSPLKSFELCISYWSSFSKFQMEQKIRRDRNLLSRIRIRNVNQQKRRILYSIYTLHMYSIVSICAVRSTSRNNWWHALKMKPWISRQIKCGNAMPTFQIRNFRAKFIISRHFSCNTSTWILTSTPPFHM